MAGRTVVPHHLADLVFLHHLDEPVAAQQQDQKGGQRGADGAEGDIAKNIQRAEIGMERIEKMIEHGGCP